jgi:mxaD protein
MDIRTVLDRPWLRRAAGLAVFAALAALAGPARAGDLQVVSSVELKASPSEVWALVGAFDNLQGWHPAVESSTMNGSPTAVGSTRVLSLKGGGEIKEELTSYSSSAMRLTYKILESPLPISNYESFLAVTDAGNGDSLVIWGSRFDAKGATPAKARGVIAGIYKAGLETLAKKFGAAP